MQKPTYQLVIRHCEHCIYFTKEEEMGTCHLTPRKREVDEDYWCAHGVWIEYHAEDGTFKFHMPGEYIPIFPAPPPKPTLDELRELIRQGVEDDIEQ
jgi:hypothetical protein